MSLEKVYIYPTDTVWGIGGAILSESIDQQVNAIKNSSANKPLSLLYPSVEQLQFDLNLPPKIDWEKCFQMELTACFDVELLKKNLPVHVLKGSKKVFVRVLNYPWIDKIFRESGSAISTTSLNLSGQDPITNFEQAKSFYLDLIKNKNNFKHEIIFVDESLDLSGRPSTIIDFSATELNVIRSGSQTNEILKIVGL